MISGYGAFFDLDHKRSGDIFSNFQNKYFEPKHVKPAVVEGEIKRPLDVEQLHG